MPALTDFEQYLLQKLEEKDQLILSMQNTISSLNTTVDTMAVTIEELSQKIAALTEQIKKNSNNSSKPPSSDGYKKPAPKSLREKSGKKQGGQKGHVRKYLATTVKADETFDYMPERCKLLLGMFNGFLIKRYLNSYGFSSLYGLYLSSD